MTAQGGAARTGLTFIAGVIAVRVTEIAATRALHDVAADGRHIAQLRGGGAGEALRQRRRRLLQRGVLLHMAHFAQAADADKAVADRDLCKAGQPGDIDERVGLFHVALHQVDKRGAARQQAMARRAGGHGRLADIGGALIVKFSHAVCSSFSCCAASRTAATIKG